MTKAQLNDFAFRVLVSSIVGAKALFVIVNWSGPNGYGAHPGRIFDLLSGGLVFYGGFIGAALAGLFWAKQNRVPFRVLADVCIPSVALGHFFGRIGCISAGCCYGKVCHDPAFFLGAEYRPGSGAFAEMAKDARWADFIVQHGHTPALHPTQLYEGVGELFLFVVLLYLRPWKRFDGQLLAIWLGLYGVLRLSIEMFRGDWLRGMIWRWPTENPLLLSTSQLIGVGMVTLAAVLWFAWRPRGLAKLDETGGPSPEAA
jgi:phosphatidylglycerol:prolipoprotein diacylglycerol transferase